MSLLHPTAPRAPPGSGPGLGWECPRERFQPLRDPQGDSRGQEGAEHGAGSRGTPMSHRPPCLEQSDPTEPGCLGLSGAGPFAPLRGSLCPLPAVPPVPPAQGRAQPWHCHHPLLPSKPSRQGFGIFQPNSAHSSHGFKPPPPASSCPKEHFGKEKSPW